jgi:hypothetical protein
MHRGAGTLAWRRKCRGVVVGIQASSRTVERIYVRNDGSMRGAGRIHCPADARRAEKEAADVFGLACAREFSGERIADANGYAAKLRQDLAASRARRASYAQDS